MIQRGVEATLVSVLRELGNVFGTERVVEAAGTVLKSAATTKAVVDDNVAVVLGLAGLPTKADVDGLRRQLDVVQATLANLSRKLDRLLEERSREAAGVETGPAHRKRQARRPG